MSRFLAVCLAGGVLCLPVYGQQLAPGDGLRLLERIATAAQRLNYSGVFVYQSGNQSETSRITHLGGDGDEFERLETLDGSPRRVVRRNDEVRCYFPENRLVIIEQRSIQRSFPALLPGCLAGLTQHYTIRKVATGRVAGVDCQIIAVEPKDRYRYGHRLWVDPESGLLLKAALLNEKGEAIESFAFTEIKIGGEDVAPANFVEAPPGSWQVHQVSTREAKHVDGQWQFKSPLPGFRRQSGIRRQVTPGGQEGTQVVFSDGLAAVSVFIEPASAEQVNIGQGPFSIGAINVVRRRVGDFQLVVMGDVPATALREFADGIEPRGK